jgi:hypothetical protein
MVIPANRRTSFAGLVFLAQHHTLFATPALVQLAKNAKSRGPEGRSIW